MQRLRPHQPEDFNIILAAEKEMWSFNSIPSGKQQQVAFSLKGILKMNDIHT